MSALRRATRVIFQRLTPFPYAHGRAFATYYASLMASQWNSAEELQDMQLAKLQQLVRHAYQQVPHYRRAMESAGLVPEDCRSLESISRLPTLDKGTLRSEFSQLTAGNAARFRPVTHHTSGSTGIPQKILLDRQNVAFERATAWRHYDWAGYHHREPMAVLRGAVVPEGRNWYKPDPWTLVLSSFRLKSETLEDYVQALRRFRPVLIRAYPSALYFLAQLLERHGVEEIRPRAIVTASESLLPHQRAAIERILGCAILDWYGSGEHVAIISQCPAGKYHVHMEYGIVEYERSPQFDRDGELAYEIICTGLNNYAMPLLRYRIGDIVRLSEGDACDCGRGLPVVSGVEGRMDDVIVTSDGRALPASGMTLAFEFSEAISQAQLVQESIDELIIRIVKLDSYTEQDHAFVLDQVRSRIGETMRLRVDFVDEISRLPSGKQPFAISRVRPEEVL
jgi:phenylacetate-CoA ligase